MAACHRWPTSGRFVLYIAIILGIVALVKILKTGDVVEPGGDQLSEFDKGLENNRTAVCDRCGLRVQPPCKVVSWCWVVQGIYAAGFVRCRDASAASGGTGARPPGLTRALPACRPGWRSCVRARTSPARTGSPPRRSGQAPQGLRPLLH